ncbi:MAG: hypothetical protein IBJ13_05815, partial [Sphingopyxis sp.]|nr:hypothetical protein [Sphingopyxis sp.]
MTMKGSRHPLSADPLFPGERRVLGHHFPVLAWSSPGDDDKPLLILVPGGGHLARVYYGHPGSDPRDFLAHWLARRGYGLLALSYPSDHPANPAPCADMDVVDWAQDLAAATASHVAAGREVILVGWSMAGRLARAFRLAGGDLGLRCDRM